MMFPQSIRTGARAGGAAAIIDPGAVATVDSISAYSDLTEVDHVFRGRDYVTLAGKGAGKGMSCLIHPGFVISQTTASAQPAGPSTFNGVAQLCDYDGNDSVGGSDGSPTLGLPAFILQSVRIDSASAGRGIFGGVNYGCRQGASAGDLELIGASVADGSINIGTGTFAIVTAYFDASGGSYLRKNLEAPVAAPSIDPGSTSSLQLGRYTSGNTQSDCSIIDTVVTYSMSTDKLEALIRFMAQIAAVSV